MHLTPSRTVRAAAAALAISGLALAVPSIAMATPAALGPLTASVAPSLYAGVVIIPGQATVTYSTPDPSQVRYVTVDWGDGIKDFATGHVYANPGTYEIVVTATDFSGQSVSAAPIWFTAGLGTRIDQPVRSYDSRTSRSVAANATVRLAAADLEPFAVKDTTNKSVTVTVTVVHPQKAGWIIAYPEGATRPTASTLNFTAGQTVANVTDVVAGSNGYIDFYNASPGTIDLLVDTIADQTVNGMMPVPGTIGYSTPTSYVPVDPVRVLDTRTGFGGQRTVIGHSFPTISLDGTPGLPNNFSGVAVFNIATTNTRSAGYLSVADDTRNVPTTSVSNWAKGQTVSNLVLARALGGEVWLYNGGAGDADFVVDLVGYYAYWGVGPNGAYYLPAQPARLLDTRSGPQLAPGQTITAHVPTSAANTVAAELNLTATGATGGGYLIVYPHGHNRPTASSINFTANTSVANATIMRLGSNNSIDIYNGGSHPVDVLVDLEGTYFTY